MSTLFLISFGIRACLVATLLAIPCLFAGKFAPARRIGQALLLLGTIAGATAGALLPSSGIGTVALTMPQSLTGFALSLSAFSAIFFAVVNLVSLLAVAYSMRYLDENRATYDVARIEGMTAIFILGMQATLMAGSVIAFMSAWEMMSLASFALVMADRAAASRKAAMLYFAMAQLGAAAIMAGFLLLTGGALNADFLTLAHQAVGLAPQTALLAFTLFFIGFGSKAGLVPLHTWLPEAHPQAPSHVSALMSGVMLKVAVYGFIVCTLSLLPPLPVNETLIVMLVGLVSAVTGALHAAVEIDIKRTLAWSSIENLGLIFLMLGTSLYARTNGMPYLATIAMTAALFHVVAHAIFKSGLFLAAGAMVHAAHSRSLERMGGLAKRMPMLSGAFLTLCLAGAAMPPFAGFIGEWLYLSGLIGALRGAAPAMQAVLVTALVGTAFTAGIALFAMIKLFAISQLGAPRSTQADHAHEPAALIVTPVIILAVLVALGGAFAAVVLRGLGLKTVLAGQTALASISVHGGTLAPSALAAAVIAALALAYVARKALSQGSTERAYHTWDCGQPITPRMEYTATAFSAPIRFFFRGIIGMRKEVAISPGAHPLVVRREMLLAGRTFWESYLYAPIATGSHRIGDFVRKLQSGSIQAYLLLIFVALVVTLTLAV